MSQEVTTAPVVSIPISQLQPDPLQPRKEFRPETIEALAQSIRSVGVLQPLLVRPVDDGAPGQYWIVAGERRFRAAKTLGLETLPCRVVPYAHTEAALIALVENLHRDDLSDIDKAEALQRIRLLRGGTWEEIAQQVQLSADYAKRLTGLLRLEEFVKQKVRSGEIPARTAIALRPLPPEQQLQMAQRVLAEGLTAEQVRTAARAMRRTPGAGPKPTAAEARGRIQTMVALPTGDRETALVGALKACADRVREIEEWLQSRDWRPDRVTCPQKAALEELKIQTTLLNQYAEYVLSSVRGGRSAYWGDYGSYVAAPQPDDEPEDSASGS